MPPHTRLADTLFYPVDPHANLRTAGTPAIPIRIGPVRNSTKRRDISGQHIGNQGTHLTGIRRIDLLNGFKNVTVIPGGLLSGMVLLERLIMDARETAFKFQQSTGRFRRTPQ